MYLYERWVGGGGVCWGGVRGNEGGMGVMKVCV